MSPGVGDAPDGRSTTRAYLGLIGELPRMNACASLLALTDGAHRDARALPPAPIHPTTRPGAYLDVRSLLERTASARCRLLVHVDKPPVLSEARRWLS